MKFMMKVATQFKVDQSELTLDIYKLIYILQSAIVGARK